MALSEFGNFLSWKQLMKTWTISRFGYYCLFVQQEYWTNQHAAFGTN